MTKLLQRLVLVKEGELAALLWSAGYFFFLLSSYYILRPVRETMGIDRGADKLPWLMAGTMAAMFLANPLFSALVSRLPRRRFIPMTYRFFIVNLLVFYGLMQTMPEGYKTGLGYAFYIWVSVFNLFAVSVFWSFMADNFTTEQSKRLFAFIGVGGTLGAIVGAAMTAGLVKTLGPFNMLLVSIVLLEVAVQCMRRLSRRFGLDRDASPERLAAAAAREPGPGILTGVALVAKSPYLLLICAYLFLYTVLNTFLYMEQGRIVDAVIPDRAARTAVFAQMDMWTNVITITAQLFLAGRLIRRIGVGWTLTLVPLVTGIGFTALWFISGRTEDLADPASGQLALSVLMAFQISRRGVHYAVSNPTRQILFTGLSADVVYKSKPFIDTFIYRGGDLVGAFAPKKIVAAAGVLGLSASAAVPLAAIPIAGVSLGVGLILGRLHKVQARRRAELAGEDGATA